MKSRWPLVLASAAFLALAGCSSSGGYSSGTTHVGVSYGYPYYGPGWGYYPYPCCWDDDPHHHPGKPDKPDRPNKPVKPIQPLNPRPLPGRPVYTPGAPSRPPANIGRPVTRPVTRPAPRPMPRMRMRR